jgi:hypothetical protein
MATTEHINRNIRLLAAYNRHTQADLGRFLQRDVRTIKARLRGDSGWPQYDLARLAEWYGVVTLDAPYLTFGPEGPQVALRVTGGYPTAGEAVA